jgi:hypothetical protein
MEADEDKMVEALQRHLLQWNRAGCILQGKGTEREGQQACRQGRMLFDLVVLEGSDMHFEDQVGPGWAAGLLDRWSCWWDCQGECCAGPGQVAAVRPAAVGLGDSNTSF